MNRILSLFLFCSTMLVAASCNKNSDGPTSQFTLGGIHDINFNSSATSNVLTVTVEKGLGTQQRVELSVTGLPNGISVDIEPNAGIPPYTSTITFHEYSNGPGGGTYPVKITGTTPSGSRDYDVNIIVPPNGFSVDATDTLDLANFGSTWVNVTKTTGHVEPVTLSVTSLPIQLGYSLSSASGTPTFPSMLDLIEDPILPTGYYPIKIIGTSASYSQTKNMIIHAPTWKGYTIDNKQYRAHVEEQSGDYQLVDNKGHQQVEIDITGTYWPSTDGTYHYNVGGNYIGAQVDIYYGANLDYKTSITQSTPNGLTMVMTGGKVSFAASNITLYKLSGNGPPQVTISIDAAQK